MRRAPLGGHRDARGQPTGCIVRICGQRGGLGLLPGLAVRPRGAGDAAAQGLEGLAELVGDHLLDRLGRGHAGQFDRELVGQALQGLAQVGVLAGERCADGLDPHDLAPVRLEPEVLAPVPRPG